MPNYVEIEEARNLPGLRMILSPGVPGPWSEACKGIFYVKKIPYVPVRQRMGVDPALREWTAQDSAPVTILDDERPRSIWIDQLYLAERLAPQPPLVPSSIEDRTLMFGYCNELCGENGFGWSKRLLLFHSALSNPNASQRERAFSETLGRKYGYEPGLAESARARLVEILRTLSTRLDEQRQRGSRFFIGDQLCALDIYWAAFCALINPLPEELCPMPASFRKTYTNQDPVIAAAASPLLMEHRDFIYHEYLQLPVDC